ncbi:hypothetical protein CKA32_000659 [Geitlerinema sp. FC II]|nr:hypothetical protein CKA32_000659 [Geitlerinema sp. FC II]
MGFSTGITKTINLRKLVSIPRRDFWVFQRRSLPSATLLFRRFNP